MRKIVSLVYIVALLFVGCSKSQLTNVKTDNSSLENETIDDGKEGAASEPSKSILFVGDSLSSGSKFALRMVEFMNEPSQFCEDALSKKNNAQSYARPSASPRHFADTTGSNKDWLCKQKKIYRNGTAKNMSGKELCKNTLNRSVFDKLVGFHKPKITILALGTNSIGFSASFIKKKVKRMLDSLPVESDCYWIAPTATSSKYISRIRRAEVAIEATLMDYKRVKCTLIKSIDAMLEQKDCAKFNSSDGLHHTSCGSELWADFSIDQICNLQNFQGPF